MKLFYETRLLFVRNVRLSFRNPAWILFGLFQPACYLLFFAPLLDPISRIAGFPAGGGMLAFTPGCMVLMGIFGPLYSGFGLLQEWRSGFLERLHVAPISRWAFPLSKIGYDVLVLLVQVILIVLLACLMGLRPDIRGVLLSLLLIALMGAFLSACSYALALWLQSEDALSSFLSTLSIPLMLLSGIMLPLSLAPVLLRLIARVNPFSYAVTATRALFQGNFLSGEIPLSFGLMFVLTLLALFWAVRSFKPAL
ncbi:ABC-2 type transport system permease protein [Thermosporothrix hazakensis]|jgi:ABC-2 type transport system permease protein|uniref:Transport permease protein n=2 Tax=Thermosporothrix TaxID=768650 RepID=A0A326U141_THEHA|nr:ABC transporter permease [Thermosporothrix hazakensis]PZW24209.1 ABC-2 type transport system permease protein [Thermosporothrix hazakensis]BBH89654.1 transport permease protein [Thermosporothrix sp. COM3]GCE47840.1 transport permease protein [Thermosporothrix hazakensis]